MDVTPPAPARRVGIKAAAPRPHCRVSNARALCNGNVFPLFLYERNFIISLMLQKRTWLVST